MKNTLPMMVLLAGTVAMTSGCEIQPTYGDVRVQGRDYEARVVFTDQDRALIRDYYRINYRSLPPGLAKQGKVPPGHAMKLARNQPLPSGAQWRYLPENLDRRLSRLPDDYVRIMVGADVGIMNVRTRIIVDLIEDLDD
jgi:hypothetical protein